MSIIPFVVLSAICYSAGAAALPTVFVLFIFHVVWSYEFRETYISELRNWDGLDRH